MYVHTVHNSLSDNKYNITKRKTIFKHLSRVKLHIHGVSMLLHTVLPMLHTFPPYLNKLVRTIPQLSPTFLPILIYWCERV
jgi:hypothetical protein